MSTAKKHPATGEHHHDHAQHHGPAWKRLHRDWRAWVVVGLMLAAMLAYVVTNDESLRLGSPRNKPASASTAK